MKANWKVEINEYEEDLIPLRFDLLTLISFFVTQVRERGVINKGNEVILDLWNRKHGN